MCGIAIEVKNNEISSIKGDTDDPFSKGHICPKALALKDIQEDPDRLKQPLLKTADGWKTISWNKAFDLVASKTRETQKVFGKNAVGAYFGNPNTHHHGNILFLLPFIQALKTKNRFSATSNDQLPHMQANLELFGNQYLFPVPDIDHMDLFILLGANPAASNGSLMTAPDFLSRLKKIAKRGEVILIDPRRTETAKACSEHLFIRPGTDAYLLLAICHTLFKEKLVETGRLSPYLDGLAEVQFLSEEFSPERVSLITGIDADKITALARKLAKTPRACLFGRMGTSTQEFGGIATWLIYVINTLTNHLDERGGLMFTKPAADMIELSDWLGQKGHINRYQSQSGLPEFGGELPASSMADQILTEGPEQIKMMYVVAGNPLLSSPNSTRLEQAFNSLDFMVSIDFYVNETSRLADIILPPTAPLEQSHYDLVFNLISVRNVAKYSPSLFEKARNTRHDWEIFLELKKRLNSVDIASRAGELASYPILKMLGPDGLLDLILRSGPYGTQLPGTSQTGRFLVDAIQGFIPSKHPLRRILDLSPYGSPNRSLSKGLCISSLLNYPHGIDLGPLQSRLPERLYTPKKRIRLAPLNYLRDMSRVRSAIKDAESAMQSSPKKKAANLLKEEFMMIGRRHVRSNNSWLHNSLRLIKGKNRCTLLMHPQDARRLKLNDGDIATVESRTGRIHIEMQITDDIMPGVISIPHGWGHTAADLQLSVAATQPGVNINLLTDDARVDNLTGTSVLNGIPVKVSRLKHRVTGSNPTTTGKSQKKPHSANSTEHTHDHTL
jgi:anaerobic selenocysteine-containing dehydrogenase